MRDWPAIALSRLEAGETLALVTLIAVEGSAPREAGAKMLVGPLREWGTIGGGALERQVSDQARRMIAQAPAPRFAVQDYPLGPLLAQCCGGRVRVLIERLDGGDRSWLAEMARLIAADQPFALQTRLGASPAKSVRAGQAGPADQVTMNGAAATARGVKPGCGDLIVEASPPPHAGLVMFGAGHVGLAVARAIEPLPFRVSWYDSRPDRRARPGLIIAEPGVLIEAAKRPSDFTLVLTHDHALDYALVSAALSGNGRGYLGLIGSRTKRARFFSRLRADSLGEQAQARLVCPIGLPQLRGKAPEVIAAGVAADLLLRLQARADAPIRSEALASL